MWLQRLLGISRKAKLMSQCFESHGRTVADNRVPWALPNWGVYCTYFELWPNPVVKIWQFQPMLSELRELLATLCVRRKQVSAHAWTPSSGDGTKVAGSTSIPRKNKCTGSQVAMANQIPCITTSRRFHVWKEACDWSLRRLPVHFFSLRIGRILSSLYCRFPWQHCIRAKSSKYRATTEQLPSNHRASTELVQLPSKPLACTVGAP